ncbi:hypothetical protein [Wenyingzhuangia sp. IMCC45574]
MNKLSFILFFTLFTHNAFSQIDELSFIKLEVSQSLKIVDNKVLITINNRFKDVEVKVYSTDRKEDLKEFDRKYLDTTFNIKISTYKELFKKVKKIDLNEFVQYSNSLGLDGYTCRLEFGSGMNSIRLKSFMPSSDTDKRGLGVYFELCKEIAALATDADIVAF